MKKNEFFNELRKKLKILKKEEVEDIIREYEDNINEKIKNGYSEEDAIKSFGNIDELCNEILDAYKISYENTNSFEDVVSNHVSKISNWLKNIISNFSNDTAEEILNMIFKVFAIIILIFILRLPYYLILGIGHMILEIFPSPIDDILTFLWTLVLEISYIIIAIMMFMSIFKNNKREKKIKIKEDKPVFENVKVKNKKETTKDSSILKFFISFGIFVTKIFSIFLVVPMVLLLVFALICLGLVISFIFDSVFLLGPMITILGFVIFLISIIMFITKCIFKREVK